MKLLIKKIPQQYVLVFICVALLASCSLVGGRSERPADAVIRGINYVGISVRDIEATTEHLQHSFDFQTVQEMKLRTEPVVDALTARPDSHLKTRLLRSSNAQLRLLEFADRSPQSEQTPMVEVNGPGIAHVCVQVAASTQSYQKFLSGGGVPVGSPDMVQLNPKNPVHYAYARDKNNTMYEIEHVEIEKLNLDTPPKNTHRIRHVALASPDIDRLVKFYGVLLQQKRPRRLGNWFLLKGEKFDAVSGLAESKLKMAFFNVRNMELEIAQYLSHPTELPQKPRPIDALGHSIIMFDVSGIEAAKALLVKAGGTVVAEQDAFDGGAIMVGRDPDGNLLGFQSLDPGSPLSAQNFDGDGT